MSETFESLETKNKRLEEANKELTKIKNAQDIQISELQEEIISLKDELNKLKSAKRI